MSAIVPDTVPGMGRESLNKLHNLQRSCNVGEKMDEKISAHSTALVTFNGRWTLHPAFASDVETTTHPRHPHTPRG